MTMPIEDTGAVALDINCFASPTEIGPDDIPKSDFLWWCTLYQFKLAYTVAGGIWQVLFERHFQNGSPKQTFAFITDEAGKNELITRLQPAFTDAGIVCQAPGDYFTAKIWREA